MVTMVVLEGVARVMLEGDTVADSPDDSVDILAGVEVLNELSDVLVKPRRAKNVVA